MLCLCTPCGEQGEVRLVLVLRVDATADVAEIALVHPYVELATAADGVVAGAVVATPYDVVVQADLRGVVWTRQLSSPQGHVDEATLTAVSGLLVGGTTAAAGIRTGVVLGGRGDRRWAFKAGEGRALDLLSGAATAALIAGHET